LGISKKNISKKYNLPILIHFLRLTGSLGFWAGIVRKKIILPNFYYFYFFFTDTLFKAEGVAGILGWDGTQKK
jgi:hypothetical protein